MSDLPDLDQRQLARELERCGVAVLEERVLERLFVHYRELRRWDRVHGLVGRNEGRHIVERHYAEALAVRDLVEGPARLLDIGAGAGFPGLVLAAARPELEVTLVESRGKKAAFLRSTASEMGCPVTCLQVRLEPRLPDALPEAVHFIALRAVKLPPSTWESLAVRYGSSVRALVWAGETDPELPDVWRLEHEAALPSGGHRRLLVFARRAPS